LGWAWFGRQYARGDENNRDVHGAIPAYSVAQAFARYRLRREWEISLKVDNLFDRRYQSFWRARPQFLYRLRRHFRCAAAVPEQFVSPARRARCGLRCATKWTGSSMSSAFSWRSS